MDKLNDKSGNQPKDKFQSDMEHFKKLNVKAETDSLPQRRVMKLETSAEPVIQQYSFGRLQREGEGSYAATKAKYGALAATDPERTTREQKDRRFSLNPLLRDPLSIEEEERRVIEEKVRVQIEALTAEAREKGRQEGYQLGLEQGHDASFKKFQEEASDRLASFESLIQELENAKIDILAGNERFLMEMIFRMAKMVALKEITADRDYVVRLAREIIESIGVRDNIRVRIHPSDAETAQLIKPGVEEKLGALKNLMVEVTADVERGGCFVDTDFNTVDATLDTQFNNIYAALVAAPVAQADKSTGVKE